MEIAQVLGLTQAQLRILHSLEAVLTQKDIQEHGKDTVVKTYWLQRWTWLLGSLDKEGAPLLTEEELLPAILDEVRSSSSDTWLYLVLLEGTLFVPYTPLGEKESEDKEYQALRYKPQTDYLKNLAAESQTVSPFYIDRFARTYKKALDKLTGKALKIALGVTATAAVAAATAATAGAAAGPIAVALFGNSVVGLHGAALTSACLAMVGGGSLAVGGAGIAGGVMTIVGGGALLGAAGGGAMASAVSLLAKSAPSFFLLQAAKLWTVMQEVLLNAHQDLDSAQAVINDLLAQIKDLQQKIKDKEQEPQADKKALTQMKKSLKYLEDAYQNMAAFKSSFELGLDLEKDE